jgi:hypothetical protein
MFAVETEPCLSVNRRPTLAAVPAAAPVFCAFTASTTSATFTAWISPVTEAVTYSGTASLYGIICANDPVNFRDPCGLASVGQVIGDVLGLAGSFEQMYTLGSLALGAAEVHPGIAAVLMAKIVGDFGANMWNLSSDVTGSKRLPSGTLPGLGRLLGEGVERIGVDASVMFFVSPLYGSQQMGRFVGRISDAASAWSAGQLFTSGIMRHDPNNMWDR